MYAYSYASVIVSINGLVIDNFAEGDDCVKVEPLVDAATEKVGADGHMVASISANRGCTVVLKLQQTSPGNAILQSLYNLQVALSAQFQPIALAVKDAMKKDAITAIGGIIKKQSVWQRGANAVDTEWTLVFEKYTVDVGVVGELASLTGVAQASQIISAIPQGAISSIF